MHFPNVMKLVIAILFQLYKEHCFILISSFSGTHPVDDNIRFFVQRLVLIDGNCLLLKCVLNFNLLKFTAGQPNHMCPRQGYALKLHQVLQDQQAQEKQLPSIHTFGFGYSIRSGLLQSIAEVGAGTYSFIPDSGMIGTARICLAMTSRFLTSHQAPSLSMQSQISIQPLPLRRL